MAETLVLDIDYNIAKAELKQKKLINQFDLQKQKVTDIKNEIKKMNSELETSQAMQNYWQKDLEETNKKLSDVMAGRIELSDEEIIKLKKRNEYDAAALAKEETFYEKTSLSLQKKDNLLSREQIRLDEIGLKLKEQYGNTERINSSWKGINKNTKGTQSNLEKNLKRVKELVKSALIFSVITKAVTAMRETFGEIISKDKQIMQDWNEVKTNLMIIGFQLYDVLKPVIQWILNAAKTLTQLISFLITSISGKGAKSAQDIAKAMKKTEESTKNITAGFDTIQTLSGGQGATSGQSDFIVASDANKKTKEELIKIGTVVGVALVGLGLILALSGVNIPLGLGMIVAGAISLYASIVPNWGALSPEVKKQLQEILTIAGGLMLALGIILLCCGIVPLGLGMIIAGSASLISAYAVSPDTFVQTVKDVLNKTEKVMDEFVDYVLYGFYEKIFGKRFADNLKNFYESFKKLWKDIFGLLDAIAENDWESAWKHLVNIAIDLLNILKSSILFPIELLNGAIEKVANLFGATFKKDISAIKIPVPDIPKLATGSVIPGGKPFLAMLGDQKAGQTNIEAPLDTIVEAFKQAQSNNNVTVRFEGSLAALGRVLKPTIDTANKRATAW